MPAYNLVCQSGDAPVNFRYTSDQRMPGAKDFKRVFEKPTSRISNKYILLLATRAEQPSTRLGLVISKKNVGNAVKRNRIKRLCREAFRMHHRDAFAGDIVLLAKPGISALDNAVISEMINKLLDRLCSEQQRSVS